MRDVSLRVLTSAAAALIVYVVLTAAANLPLWARLSLAIGTAGLCWFIANKIGVVVETRGSRVASGIRGRNIKISRVRTRGLDTIDVASDIDATHDVEINEVRREVE